MPRSRPASDPISFPKPTGQYYVTRGGKRLYLGADRDEAIRRYHRRSLGLSEPDKSARGVEISAKDLATVLSLRKKPTGGIPRRRSVATPIGLVGFSKTTRA